MSLAVNTPAHLEKLGLLKSQAKETTTYSLDDGFAIKQNELNYLMQVALDKVRHFYVLGHISYICIRHILIADQKS